MHAEHALEVYTETNSPEIWRELKSSLIKAYERRTVGDHSDKKEKLAKHNDELVDGMDMLGVDKLNLKPSSRPPESTS